VGVFRYAIVLLLALGAGRAAADEAINKVAFACAGDKTIKAAFSPEKVDLTLSDGRTMSLPQAQSGSGIRYTNPGEAIVFWSKGNTAFITEGADKKETYAGCIVVAAAPGENWATFASADEGFSLRFPRSYSVDTSYRSVPARRSAASPSPCRARRSRARTSLPIPGSRSRRSTMRRSAAPRFFCRR